MTSQHRTVELNKQTVERLGELTGVQAVVTPLKSKSAPLSIMAHNYSGQYINEYDVFQAKVNHLATHFISETLKFTLIHMQHCCSMEIRYVWAMRGRV